MKVSLITLHRVFNYGSVLQTYATQELFKKAGCDVEVVDYITEQRTNKKLFFSIPESFQGGIVKKAAYRLLKFVSVLKKKMTFGGFINRNIKLTRKKYITSDDLKKDPPIADVYITGSDQVWNSKYNEGVDAGFFLEYMPADKKAAAFVASFGKTELDAKEKEITKEYLKKYRSISVRENSAKDILTGIGYESTWLIDPTLQITKGEWSKIASRRLIPEKYLILMLLYNEDNGATEYARRIADKKGLKLVKISWDLFCPKKVDKLMTHRSPEEFLSLFMNADFVVTNSFHGLAFAINFNRQFILVPRNEFNSRLKSLLELTDLESRMVNTTDAAMIESEKEIDYSTVNKVLDEERQRAREFINEVISC